MKTKTTKTRKIKKPTKKSGIVESLVKRGQIYCVNHKKNKTPYWGGEICDTHTDHDGNIIRWVCSTCVAKLAPSPQSRQPKVDPVTGEKRKRGRPKGSKNKITTKKTTRKGKK